MNLLRVPLMAGITLIALTSNGRSQSLEGLWQSRSTAIFRVFQTPQEVVAVYERPTSDHTAAGIKPGDLALKGTFVSNVIVGTFYQRAPLEIQDICPQFKIIETPVQWEFNGDAVTGALVVIGGADGSCVVTTRRLLQSRWERVPDQGSKRHAPSSIAAIPWPLPW